MKKDFLVVALVVIVLILGAWVVYLSRQSEGVADNGNGQNRAGNGQYQVEQVHLRVNNLQAGDLISSPLLLSGEAADWYFEGSFPVRVEDTDDNVLGEGFVTAQGDWMTSDLVPFTGYITFNSAGATEGQVVFMKDNPSGLTELDEQIVIPVLFAPDLMEVQVFFNNTTQDPGLPDCTNVYAVARLIPRTQAVGTAAIGELLRGISMEEEGQGFVTQIPAGVELQSLRVEEGVAYADFNSALDYQVGGSCRVSAIRAQITETLKQFPTVDSVVISINGEVDIILQP
ncbi:MAG: hypothetical protein COU33_01575 [Candidatus Magasanikbacteria bacterium CG10_big_fil_rev_8_21_14_0_10_43_6]|uniref:GerMN domain-containing protein n=1 Tax=Candidatus Magasanikbacteria bacterium CG10_big_fil_rev_8_21_14_0_10_43_6 TaxID=1974650 RepID=A0A2M6W1R3_9BACT|nr:MAG: hypothetical protein COU33_01575 [Candidatus Magasanikbacteria bacterium CG10_big_fil_rev_8_21_14_0_10_43_6]